MTKIMFVCHGNICRSPMAEFIMKELVRQSGRDDEFFIASSGTSNEEILNGVGNPVYPPAAEELAKHGISCGGKRAVRLQKSDYNKFDMLICMDERNYLNILRLFGGDPDDKVKKLMDYCTGGDVVDPWYSGDFTATWNDIFRGCSELIKTI